jgi:hypothetical protein
MMVVWVSSILARIFFDIVQLWGKRMEGVEVELEGVGWKGVVGVGGGWMGERH